MDTNTGNGKSNGGTSIVQVVDATVAGMATALVQDGTFKMQLAESLKAIARERLILTVEEIRNEHMRGLRSALKSAYRAAAVKAGLLDK